MFGLTAIAIDTEVWTLPTTRCYQHTLILLSRFLLLMMRENHYFNQGWIHKTIKHGIGEQN